MIDNIDEIKNEITYDPVTGQITALTSSSIRKAGKLLGSKNSEGYLLVWLSGKNMLSHRVAWALHYGSWPSGRIDHINGDKTDNRISNLRDVDNSVNCQNQRKPQVINTTGFLGVCFEKSRNKWKAQINSDGKIKNLGRFSTPELAHAAYLEAKRRLHKGCTI